MLQHRVKQGKKQEKKLDDVCEQGAYEFTIYIEIKDVDIENDAYGRKEIYAKSYSYGSGDPC